jgi:hypothetical protein
LPVAVILKRFFAPDLVFILGISLFLNRPFRARSDCVSRPPRHAYRPGDQVEAAGYKAPAARCKAFGKVFRYCSKRNTPLARSWII